MIVIATEYLAAGGNRHPSAADWQDDLLAFGSGNNIALWHPQDGFQKGVFTTLCGHSDTVNAVKLLSLPGNPRPVIISGSADKTVNVWSFDGVWYQNASYLPQHEASVNTIAVLQGCETFVTGAADGTLKVWKIAFHDYRLPKDGKPLCHDPYAVRTVVHGRCLGYGQLTIEPHRRTQTQILYSRSI